MDIKTVASRVGHSDVQTTLYIHIILKSQIKKQVI